jgi:hypothetical protein
MVCSRAVTKELLAVNMMPPSRAQFFPKSQLITYINFCTLVTLVFPEIFFRSSHEFKDGSFKLSPQAMREEFQ